MVFLTFPPIVHHKLPVSDSHFNLQRRIDGASWQVLTHPVVEAHLPNKFVNVSGLILC